MPVPEALQQAVEQEIASADRARVTRAAEQITASYKTERFSGSLDSAEARAAYLITRLPATYAACEAVFAEITKRMREFSPKSLLDLGAGPGTASWAAAEQWRSVRQFRLLEANGNFVEVGKRLANASDRIGSATWDVIDLEQTKELPSADLVVLSYALGEFEKPYQVVKKAWSAARQLLVVIEPGTPRNFEAMAQVRQELIAANGKAVAPCPHEIQCPMAIADDWCHFAVRLQRTSQHRQMKRGSLGYEDEKFCYLAFAKEAANRAETRIVRHPMVHSGFIRLTLCTPTGLKEETVTKSRREAFRAARRAKWGDEWRQLE